jgi:hypothetical protein
MTSRVKCACGDAPNATPTYCSGTKRPDGEWMPCRHGHRGEHLVRACPRCGRQQIDPLQPRSAGCQPED